MAREKFQTLTEQMFYILLCLRQEQCGADIMAQVSALTEGRVTVGPGTLYNLLEQFLSAGYIRETRVEGRKRSYLITEAGRKALSDENRLLILCALLEKPMTVGELAGAVPGISGPALSQHLQKLRAGQLVQAQKEGQFVRYSIKDERLYALMALLKKEYCGETAL